MAELKDLIGETLTKVEQVGDRKIVFITSEGKRYELYHKPECCEVVAIESIGGDLADLVGEPILIAEEATNRNENQEGVTKEHQYQDSDLTWTFYKFATRKGYVDIRWYGVSNGYYSTSVDFEEA